MAILWFETQVVRVLEGPAPFSDVQYTCFVNVVRMTFPPTYIHNMLNICIFHTCIDSTERYEKAQNVCTASCMSF